MTYVVVELCVDCKYTDCAAVCPGCGSEYPESRIEGIGQEVVRCASCGAALARAQAIDVTAVLVFGQVITSLLAAGMEGVSIGSQVTGLALIAVGVGPLHWQAASTLIEWSQRDRRPG